jgi:hypothetical protein
MIVPNENAVFRGVVGFNAQVQKNPNRDFHVYLLVSWRGKQYGSYKKYRYVIMMLYHVLFGTHARRNPTHAILFARAKTTDHSIDRPIPPSATHFFRILHFLYSIGTFDHIVDF